MFHYKPPSTPRITFNDSLVSPSHLLSAMLEKSDSDWNKDGCTHFDPGHNHLARSLDSGDVIYPEALQDVVRHDMALVLLHSRANY